MACSVRTAAIIACPLLLGAADAGAAAAPGYPVKPIRLIVPFPPGGSVDAVGRLVGQKLQESVGQPVVIDNRAGAGGIVASELTARAAPDGYTLSIANNSTHGVNQALAPKLPYDAIRDFTPISQIAAAPHLLLTGTAVAANSVNELIALARAKPGQLNFGSAGTGSQTHLSGELFKFVTGIDIVHIPYKGTGPAYTALLTGEIQLLVSGTVGSLHHVRAGRLKALGITGRKRSHLVPHLPTLLEQGVTGFESGPWYALVGPAGVPHFIVARLHQQLVSILKTSDMREKFSAQGAEPVGGTPAELTETMKNELAKWARLVKEIGLRAD